MQSRYKKLVNYNGETLTFVQLFDCIQFHVFLILSSDRQSIIISPSPVEFFASPFYCVYGKASLQMYLHILSNKSVFIIYTVYLKSRLRAREKMPISGFARLLDAV